MIDGEAPKFTVLDHIVKLKTSIKYAPCIAVHGDESFRIVLNRMSVAVKLIEAGVFPPAKADAWWCSSRWCGFYETCKYVRHPVQVTIKGTKT